MLYVYGDVIVSTDQGVAYVCKGGSMYAERFGNTQLEGTSADMRKTGHKSPPKGYPKERSKYAVPEEYLFPINNAEHTRAAIGYFSSHEWKTSEHKGKAARRILAAARKFGIEVSKDSDVARAAHA